VPQHDVPDLLTNLVACSANQPALFDRVEQIVKDTKLVSNEIQAYEYHFNLSQTLLKKKQFQSSLEAINLAKDLLKQDGEHESDTARFKTQELHMLNQLLSCFVQVDYPQVARFNLPKTVTHNNLVELNMNALRGNYQVDEAQFKDLIGNLNWKKFAERI
jgi:hypothetical protein